LCRVELETDVRDPVQKQVEDMVAVVGAAVGYAFSEVFHGRYYDPVSPAVGEMGRALRLRRAAAGGRCP
jgi:hypothetical protein